MAGKREWVSNDWFYSIISLVENVAEVSGPITNRSKAKPKQSWSISDTQLKNMKLILTGSFKSHRKNWKR